MYLAAEEQQLAKQGQVGSHFENSGIQTQSEEM